MRCSFRASEDVLEALLYVVLDDLVPCQNFQYSVGRARVEVSLMRLRVVLRDRISKTNLEARQHGHVIGVPRCLRCPRLRVNLALVFGLLSGTNHVLGIRYAFRAK